jgi:hypothetical protein
MKTSRWRIVSLLVPALSALSALPAATRGAVRASVDCGPEIKGLASVLKETRFLIFGEIHGTAEIPAFFARSVCQAARSGDAIVAALEIPVPEQARIDAYMKSPGSDLVSGPFWASEYQDGRGSRAMLDLIDKLREMKRAGLRVEVVAFDPALASGDRDAYLAETLSKHRRAKPAAQFMVLTGNLHARRDVHTNGDSARRFMANRLADEEPSLVTLNVVYPGGTAWICTSAAPESCGEQKLGSRNKEAGLRTEGAFAPCADAAYCGTFSVGEVHPSPPAFQRPR